MTQIPVTVIIVSRARPDALVRCLTGIAQQYYSPFEVVVVTDPAGEAAVEDSKFADVVKLVHFDQENISEARNLGIAHAAGDVVAFIDDDAVPEPTWLMHLVAPFSESEVSASGGYVRGRNGISFQWTAQTVDAGGRTSPLEVDQENPTVLTGFGGRAIKTEGTNMAFRRDVLVKMGGFDPSFRYFLDETDLNLRLASQGLATAVVPLAQVHHGFLENATRKTNRAPRDLFEIGASLAVFLNKHCPSDQKEAVWSEFQSDQRRRVLRYMVDGSLEPRDVRRLLARLVDGYRAGLERAFGSLPVIETPKSPFAAFPANSTLPGTVLSGRRWQRRRLRQEAENLVQKGHVVSLFLFSATSLYHRVQFTPAGVWEHRGGVFGKSIRTQPLFQVRSFRRRLREEVNRITNLRGS
nr:glycosyltransferase family 2 protein [uncultured Shimia sp.]